jgi:hypothetical protein
MYLIPQQNARQLDILFPAIGTGTTMQTLLSHISVQHYNRQPKQFALRSIIRGAKINSRWNLSLAKKV